MLKQISAFTALIVVLMLGGCDSAEPDIIETIQQEVPVAPSTRVLSWVILGTDLRIYEHYYVVKSVEDGRSINTLIADRLNSMGHSAVTGTNSQVPENADIVVIYEEVWHQRMKHFLPGLSIRFSEAESRKSLAGGMSENLDRKPKSSKDMVDEVLTEIFNKNRSRNDDPK
jgi:hypothetical protein